MGTLGWLLVVAVGIALGFSVGRLWPGSAAKVTELERQRDAAREDLRIYRQDVSTHFERTAHLFDKVTADYRGLYEHLALGARQLSAIRGEAAEQRLAEPEQRRLATVAAKPAGASPEELAPSSSEELDSPPADTGEPQERTEPAAEDSRSASPDPGADPYPDPVPDTDSESAQRSTR